MSNSLKLYKKKLSISEKLMLRLCIVFFILILTFIFFSYKANKALEESKILISKISTETQKNLDLMDLEYKMIKNKTDQYTRAVESLKSLTKLENENKKNRIILQNSIPNLLNNIMALIPNEVKIISIQNESNSKKIFIVVESEKYEQLGYFSSILKTENVLKNIKSTSGSKKENTIRVTIEGELI